ncbi:MAG: hypothetical protein OEX76_00170 [Candidatus Bathyarchaeota archaeon]|nr:hypothetical protein [Candidatus Bathyarchaeota archaeon]MDH5531866.1 hypothetical protein [Candidatus Bathyarchaeota archaeon]MDH5712350.1 hypothetical protein [Candidatus Bathyarchaeota archaeon]
MRKTKSNKGQMRVVEALLASLVILVAITFINVFAVAPSSSMYEASESEKVGYNVLHDLDEQGLLCRFVYNKEWENLTAALMTSLPPDVYFDLTVYYLNDTVVNEGVPIRYGNPNIFETSGSVASVSYIVPGYQTNYDPKILVLQLVRE